MVWLEIAAIWLAAALLLGLFVGRIIVRRNKTTEQPMNDERKRQERRRSVRHNQHSRSQS